MPLERPQTSYLNPEEYRMRLALVMSACALMSVAPALAQTTPAPAAAAGAAAPVPEKKICRSYQTTGSIMPSRRTCHTKSEWASIDADNQGQAERIKSGNFTRPPGE
jgi:predicted transglutaminase-like cysteine proteinase